MKFYNDFYEEQQDYNVNSEIPIGCKFCWDDKKKKDRQLTFFDQANNLRSCNYCPWCGRKYGEEN